MAFTSRIARACRVSAAANNVRVAQVQRMRFSVAAVRGAGKESALHDEGRADEVEKHKQEQLKNQKSGDNAWKDELASDSETAVKADRGEAGEHGEKDIKKLQEDTKHMASEKHN